MKDIEICQAREHYEIFVDGDFYCSCDNVTEVIEEIYNLEKED